MKVAVTGGTGFIGSYVVNTLLNNNIEVIVTGTDLQKAQQYDWFEKVFFLELDINSSPSDEVLKKVAASDKLIHLAWSGLPHYKELFHIEENLLPQYFFIKKLVSLGLKDVTITGTCFEYGMQEGPLSTEITAEPQNPYALAKDTLRKFIKELQKKEDFNLKWLRLFYTYGVGQSEKSILAQLDKALERGDARFNMSGGEQLRDYLPVEEVAEIIVNYSLEYDDSFIKNVCSGVPISIKKLVLTHLEKNNKSIELNLGLYPYSDIEPFAFWGIK